MAQDHMKALVERYAADVDFKAALDSAGDVAAAVAVAEQYGFTVSEEDFAGVSPGDRDLADEELEYQAGGGQSAIMVLCAPTQLLCTAGICK